MKIWLLISQPPTGAGNRVEITFQPQVYPLPAYWEANVAGVLVAPAQIAICHIPACTPQFFELLEPNKPSGPWESYR
jgi:hypothetical protein